MDLTLGPEQEAIRDAIRGVLARSPAAGARARRDGERAAGSTTRCGARPPSSAASASALPEAAGGAGYALTEEMVLFEELGRALAPGPWLGTRARRARARRRRRRARRLARRARRRACASRVVDDPGRRARRAARGSTARRARVLDAGAARRASSSSAREARPLRRRARRAASTSSAAEHRPDAPHRRRVTLRGARRDAARRRRRGARGCAATVLAAAEAVGVAERDGRDVGRVRQGAPAVRQADRLVPGGQAPLRRHGGARRGGALGDDVRGGRAARRRAGRRASTSHVAKVLAADAAIAERHRQRPEPRRHGLHVGVRRAPVSQARAAARALLRHAHGASRRARGALARAALSAARRLRRRHAARFPALRHRTSGATCSGRASRWSGFWMQSGGAGLARLPAVGLRAGARRGRRSSATCRCFCLSPIAGRRRRSGRQVAAHPASRRAPPMLLALALGDARRRAALATVPLVAVLRLRARHRRARSTCRRGSRSWSRWSARDDLPSAIALNASIFNTARVVGPAIAGILVATVGEAPCFFLNGASYLAVLWALAGMRLAAGGRSRAVAAAARRALGPALRAPRSRCRRRCCSRSGSCRRSALQANVLMPSLAQRTFGAGATGYGLLLTAYGVGAVALGAAARVAARTRAPSTGGRCSPASWSSAPVCSASRRARRFAIAVACQLVAGLGMIRFTATTNTLDPAPGRRRLPRPRDGAAHGHVHGRGADRSLLLGAIAEPFGPRAALVISAAAPLVAAAFLWRRLDRRARTIDQWDADSARSRRELAWRLSCGSTSSRPTRRCGSWRASSSSGTDIQKLFGFPGGMPPDAGLHHMGRGPIELIGACWS